MNTQASWSINIAKLGHMVSHGQYMANNSHPCRCVHEMCLVTTFYAEVREVVLQNATAPNSFCQL